MKTSLEQRRATRRRYENLFGIALVTRRRYENLFGIAPGYPKEI